ncbi:hypothetical protein BBK82_34085 [Lentzea guizhouensis]|uniref:Secreted protein n=1 Tax=Lentzea guizhouensis TaxID=1586287 RepID=A0A1B2HRG1_9PSEU|nr:hypothetical protein [Lentzea guizhouensis]ANZ40314.1 hypothetical protein BBK82_34085 [Lentzea guizhouensis]
MSITAAVTSAALLATLSAPLPATGPVEPDAASAGCTTTHCLEIERTGTDYTTWAWFTQDIALGYFRLTGPNLNVTTPVKRWRAGEETQHYTRPGRGQVCAEPWTYHSGRWHSHGMSCVRL